MFQICKYIIIVIEGGNPYIKIYKNFIGMLGETTKFTKKRSKFYV